MSSVAYDISISAMNRSFLEENDSDMNKETFDVVKQRQIIEMLLHVSERLEKIEKTWKVITKVTLTESFYKDITENVEP